MCLLDLRIIFGLIVFKKQKAQEELLSTPLNWGILIKGLFQEEVSP